MRSGYRLISRINCDRCVKRMSNYSEITRWWENYLVRYFMPSIAGIAIVSWLAATSEEGFKTTLMILAPLHSLDAPTLTLIVLYGNLFCYVASYPVLCFHVTRSIDLPRCKWRP